jgi:hypothetical protein
MNFLSFVFFDIKDHAKLVSEMQTHIDRGAFLGEEYGAACKQVQSWRWKTGPSERDRKQYRRVPLPLQEDREPNRCQLLPPLAWTLLWGGTYSNIFGESLRRTARKGVGDVGCGPDLAHVLQGIPDQLLC